MAKRTTRRRTAPRRALIAPLVMLGAGMAVGVVVWHILMIAPPRQVAEHLSKQDRDALDRLLADQRAHP